MYYQVIFFNLFDFIGKDAIFLRFKAKDVLDMDRYQSLRLNLYLEETFETF